MTETPQDDYHMPAEIGFSGGTSGKFHRPGAKIHLPVHLDAEVRAYLSALAASKVVSLSDLVNDLLKKDIAALEAAK
jgi:hypothetical protein